MLVTDVLGPDRRGDQREIHVLTDIVRFAHDAMRSIA
ncbi:hypothetical protein AF72_11160 [Xylella taiwanensis]|uniref:Uncharacterized protein n=1 Tax=Xylella taiwanensis TaxID=1444770 RepID=Z9JGV2_9GAMM|nr:hypothetical protein AF72_11160 [Xylella taiwanensis]